ncbi:hypothetical protein GCM10010495_78970 [Kitasatospora herbaricolor]|nr:hypothetical protein [Kitasatospora herbaricolor]GGV49441.1 hypothetical protein GCM10010495_78970 [Kitasatospora herbaricolor]
MDDIAQGGSEGVPPPSDSATDDRPHTAESPRGVRSVRAGAAVADQKAGHEQADRDGGATSPSDG